MELRECEIMNDVSWMGLALERKETLDKIYELLDKGITLYGDK